MESKIIYTDVPEISKIFTISTFIAKKKHLCDKCHGDIPPGAKYEYVSGQLPDDTFFVQKTCLICCRKERSQNVTKRN